MNGERGQTAPLGVALLLGLAILGTTVVVVFGATALTETQDEADLARAEQSMTQFDSQASRVALGDTAIHTTTFGQLDGTFRVEPSTGPDGGRITVTHVNFDGAGDNEDVYSGSLGTVVYESSGTEIAYQGGGVWRKQRDGSTQMISPPEFHYRLGTLTLPVIQTDGSGAGSGEMVAKTHQTTEIVRKFPDASSTYSNGDPYLNSLSEGHVVVTVESRYYKGWANYFRSRTDGTVTVDHNNDVAKLKLETLGLTGDFDMPGDPSNGGGSLEIQGMDDGHATTDFQFRIYPKDDQESSFNNLRWSMYADEGNQKFELALRANGNSDCGDSVDLSIYYSDNAHTSYEGWTGSETVKCSDEDGDGNDERYLLVDLVDPDGDDQDLTYQSFQSSQLAHFKNEFSQNDIQSTATLPGHDGDTEHDEDRTYSDGSDSEIVDFVIAHYFSELSPNFELYVEDQQGGGAAGIDEDLSRGYIDYGGGGQVVTYLHITENRVEVVLE